VIVLIALEFVINALNEIVLGILGRAQEIYGVGLCGYAFASSHYHLLLLVDTMCYLSIRSPRGSRS
jgi:hypothetical protein